MSEEGQMRGERGAKGDHGQHGDPGRRGESGDPGRTGAMGDQGIIGERGPAGDTGQIGAKGRQGETGEPGQSTLLARNVTLSFAALTGFFVLLLAGLGYFMLENRELSRDGQDAHDALCLIRASIIRDVANRKQYVADVESNKRTLIVGITLKEIKDSIEDDEKDILNLSKLDCVPPPEPPQALPTKGGTT